ncbi:hypothetical protein JKP88DRAFT_230418 [Tribonema minus]|uniref:Uncharacterized protein n=1 Tax=Tribonema minus TaxID=303371 RepID=A0A835ZHE4_9STRA|nr:hypothetical protein JKP88DRAFT_230418 [Tribonema minus]
MYMPSAAVTPQAAAIAAAAAKWGSGAAGAESISTPTCKYKYQPWSKEGHRLYACRLHDGARRKLIEKYGLRNRWEPFDQWQRPSQTTDKDSQSRQAQATALADSLQQTVRNTTANQASAAPQHSGTATNTTTKRPKKRRKATA